MLLLAQALIKTKNCHLFDPIGQKMLILHENLEFLMPGENFPLKKVNFWQMGQKDGDFLFWSTPQQKITHLLKMRFLDTLYIKYQLSFTRSKMCLKLERKWIFLLHNLQFNFSVQEVPWEKFKSIANYIINYLLTGITLIWFWLSNPQWSTV